MPINNCSGFFCFSPEGLVNTSLTGHQSQAIQGPIPWAAAAKAGTALCRNSFQGDIDKLEYLQARERERTGEASLVSREDPNSHLFSFYGLGKFPTA